MWWPFSGWLRTVVRHELSSLLGVRLLLFGARGYRRHPSMDVGLDHCRTAARWVCHLWPCDCRGQVRGGVLPSGGTAGEPGPASIISRVPGGGLGEADETRPSTAVFLGNPWAVVDLVPGQPAIAAEAAWWAISCSFLC